MIRIITLTETGRQLALRLQPHWPHSTLLHQPKPFAASVQNAFAGGDRLIMICAMGIAVRTLAPVLISKYEDPAVLVLDEAGRFVIPLLSGHEGGANEWGRQVAEQLAAELVLTTANAYLQPVYTIGMGCERHCPENELQTLLEQCLQQLDLDIALIDSLHSINLKADEAGLLTLADRLGKPLQTWSATELRSVEAQLSSRSQYVFDTVGVYGVAESAALYGARNITGNRAELVLSKHKHRRATCAVARAYPSSVVQESL